MPLPFNTKITALILAIILVFGILSPKAAFAVDDATSQPNETIEAADDVEQVNSSEQQNDATHENHTDAEDNENAISDLSVDEDIDEQVPVEVIQGPDPEPVSQESVIVSGEHVDNSSTTETSGDTNQPLTLADVYLPDLSRLDVANNGYNTMSSIAERELTVQDNTEFPRQSDCVKYNTWAWGRRVSNPYSNGQYTEKYSWNTTFLSWCANESGFVQFGKFPKATSEKEMFAWFVSEGKRIVTINELHAVSKPFTLNRDDLICFRNSEDYFFGLITNVDSQHITYILGDSNFTVESFTCNIDDLPDNTLFIRWKGELDFLVPIMKYLCDEIGMTPVAAVGTLANMQCESRYNPHAIGDGDTSYGLCQWHNGRWDALVEECDKVGLDWTTYEGQLYFLKTEFINHYQWLLEQMNACPDNKAGAEQAGFLFCVGLERPAGMEESGKYRGFIAAEQLYPALLGK